MAWVHHTWHYTANQHHPALVRPICDPPRQANSTFLAWRLTTGREVSLSMDQLSGTAYLLNFGHMTSHLMFSKPHWRHFCLTADLAHLVYFILKNGTELRVCDLHFSLCVSVCGSADMSGMADHHISGCILAGARLFCWVSKISSVFFFSCVCVIGQPGTASSSAECSRDKPPFSFVRGQDSTMCDIVWVSR